MNPFLDSTVARPLAKNHPDRCWSQPAATDVPQAHSSVSTLRARNQEYPSVSGTAGFVSRDAGVEAQKCSSVRGRSKKKCAALALGLCLSFSSLSALLSKPILLSGGIAVASMLASGNAHGVDLNSATLQELQSLSGIGPKTASMIVDERSRGGKFSSLSDLSDRVRGIGPKKAAALQAAGLTVGAAAPKAGAKIKPPQDLKKRK